jgi:hypothetical protein
LRRSRWIACDLQREYNALFETAAAYKPFHKQLAKPAFADFMRTLAGQLLDQLRVQVLQAPSDDVLADFHRIVIQDGSSFALRDELAPVYPGRFDQVKPAAVELQTTLELFEGLPSQITLTPDTASKRAYLPEPEALAGSLLLADRGYFKWANLDRLNENNASFVLRAYTSINPHVVRAFDSTGQRRPELEGRRLKQVWRAPAGSCTWQCTGPARRFGRHAPDHEAPTGSEDAFAHRDQSGAVTLQCRYGTALVSTVLAGRAAVQGIQIVCRTACLSDGQSAYCRGLDLGGSRRRDAAAVHGSSDPAVHAVEISSQRAAKAAAAALDDLFKAFAAYRVG